MTKRHITHLAERLIDQLGITTVDLGVRYELGYGAQTLYERQAHTIKFVLAQTRPGELGLLAACGRGFGDMTRKGTSLYHVHCGSYLPKYADGWTLLCEIACTAIVAEMTDILLFQMETEALAAYYGVGDS